MATLANPLNKHPKQKVERPAVDLNAPITPERLAYISAQIDEHANTFASNSQWYPMVCDLFNEVKRLQGAKPQP